MYASLVKITTISPLIIILELMMNKQLTINFKKEKQQNKPLQPKDKSRYAIQLSLSTQDSFLLFKGKFKDLLSLQERLIES